MKSRPRSSPASRKLQASKAKKDRLGYTIMALSLGVVIFLAAIGILTRPTKADPLTGCPLDRKPPQSHTILLVDETDKLSRAELAYAKALILNEYYWLPIGGRLTVRTIVSDRDSAEDIAVCRMDDGSKSLGIYDNAKMIRKTFDKTAGARLEKLYEALKNAPIQANSPIMEYVAEAMDRANFGSNVKARRLVILSDMAQHSDLHSQYGRSARGKPSKQAMEELERDMTGVHVRIQYVPRRSLSAMQGKAHRAFWTSYFEKMKAERAAVGHGLLIGEDSARETFSDGS
ncbi:hypothetical protein [Sphingomonas sp.]|uniref:hypothetical protein n=1 Tax=Sphingomonas sp. TaxID=28214 RepID=UPI002ED8B2A1